MKIELMRLSLDYCNLFYLRTNTHFGAIDLIHLSIELLISKPTSKLIGRRLTDEDSAQ
jgi:hypothetical protein